MKRESVDIETENNSQTYGDYSTGQTHFTPSAWKKVFTGASLLVLIAIGVGIYLAASRVGDKSDSPKEQEEESKSILGKSVGEDQEDRLRNDDDANAWMGNGTKDEAGTKVTNVLTCSSSKAPAQESRTKKSTRVRTARISGGSPEMHPAQYPWMAKITVSAHDLNKSVLCGGSVIDDIHVLTAAQCIPASSIDNTGFVFFDLPSLDIKIELGATKSGDFSYIASSRVGYVHQGFITNTALTVHNIAVILLNNSLTNSPLWNNLIKPVLLPEEGQAVPSTCEVSGWGASTPGSPMSRALQKLYVTVYGFEKCRLFEPFKTVFISMQSLLGEENVCSDTGFLGGRDVCFGDTGGPLMCEVEEVVQDKDNGGEKVITNSYQLGVISTTSSSAPCGFPRGYASFYPNMSFYRSWLTCIALSALQSDSKTKLQLDCLWRKCLLAGVPQTVEENVWQEGKVYSCKLYAAYVNCMRLEINPLKCDHSIVPPLHFIKLKNGTTVFQFREHILGIFEEINRALSVSGLCL